MDKMLSVSWTLLLIGTGSYVIFAGRLPISVGGDETDTWLYGWRARVIGFFFVLAGCFGLADLFGSFT